MDNQTVEALRSAKELCDFLRNNVDPHSPADGNIELIAHTDTHARQLAALLEHASLHVDAVLTAYEKQIADIGAFNSYPRGYFSFAKWNIDKRNRKP